MGVRQTQQVLVIGYNTDPPARLTAMKAEVLMQVAPVGGGGAGGTIVTIIMSG
jgi:hypothetical protein